MNFSLVITTFNRADTLIPKLREYEKYDSINEIIIFDDCSDDYETIKKEKWSDKFFIYRNDKNIKAYKNKINALMVSKNTWSLLIDSDNFISKNYINAILEENNKNELSENIIYCPVFAYPNFDYRQLEGILFDIELWNNYNDRYGTFLNMCNFCISKKAVNILKNNTNTDNTEPYGIDCKYICYILLKNGFKLKAVKDMWYDHPISKDSFYLKHEEINKNFDANFNWKI